MSVHWWSFTGVWVRAIHLKSPGFSLIFWSISILLQFGWSLLVLLFPSPPVSPSILWRLYKDLQLLLVSSSLSCSTVVVFFFQFPSKVLVLIFLFAFIQFYSVVSRGSKVSYSANSLFLLISTSYGHLSEIRLSAYISSSGSGLLLLLLHAVI